MTTAASLATIAVGHPNQGDGDTIYNAFSTVAQNFAKLNQQLNGTAYSSSTYPAQYLNVSNDITANGTISGSLVYGGVVYSRGAEVLTSASGTWNGGTVQGAGIFANNAPSNSASTGTIIIQGTGGLGVGGNIYAGGNLVVGGNLTLGNLSSTGSATFNSLTVATSTYLIGNLLIAANANIQQNFVVNGITTLKSNASVAANLAVGTFATIGSTLNVSGATTLNTVTGASFQGVIGNATPATGAFTTLSASGTVSGTGFNAYLASPPAIGSTAAAAGAFTTLTASSTLGVTGATTLTTATTGGLQAVAIGNATPGTGAFTTLTVNSTSNHIGAATFTTATTGGLQAVAIGNATPGTGAFTTLSASGITNVTNTTASTNTGTGALVVAGGAGIAGNVYIGGTLTVTGVTTFTQATEYVSTVVASTVNAATIGNISANHVGTGTYLTSLSGGNINTSSIPNTALVNSSVTVTAGTAMSGGGTVALGGSITLNNTGVTSIVAGGNVSISGGTGAVTVNASNAGVTGLFAGTGISVSAATGGVTVTNGGVTALTGTPNRVTVSASSGSVTLSGPQDIHTGASPTFAGITVPSITHSGTTGIGDIGASGAAFGTVWATATSAKYADLAENYRADQVYVPGTVLQFGGAEEVTCAAADTRKIAGVVSTDPAYLMNSHFNGNFVVAVALTGRVPCKVIGPIEKGDMLISAGNGFAKADPDPKLGSVIGKALEDFSGTQGVIEVVVGRV